MCPHCGWPIICNHLLRNDRSSLVIFGFLKKPLHIAYPCVCVCCESVLINGSNLMNQMSIIPPAPGCLAHSRQTVFPNLMDNSLCLVLQIIFHLHTHFKESPPVFRPPCWDIDSYLWGHTFGIFKLLHLLILEHSLSLLLSAPPAITLYCWRADSVHVCFSAAAAKLL